VDEWGQGGKGSISSGDQRLGIVDESMSKRCELDHDLGLSRLLRQQPVG
jgi:hypothetical protein